MRRISAFTVSSWMVLCACSSDGDAGGGSGGQAGSGGSATGSGGGATGGSNSTGSGGTGGDSAATGGTGGDGTGGTVSGTGGVPATTALVDRIDVSDAEVPEGVKRGVRNYRIWGAESLQIAPVFTVPLADCGTLVCFTTESGSTVTPRIARFDANDALVNVQSLDAGLECRGLAAEPDGHYAALLWSADQETIHVTRFDATGAPLWTEALENSDNHPTDFGIGEARLEYGDGRYGAYYHVHSDSGHEGDTLKWIDAATGAEDTEWAWGCSHSMSNLLRFNTATMRFLSACVTDCFPGTMGTFATDSKGGIYIDHDDVKVMDVNAGCNGDVAAELGSAAPSPTGYKMVFNAHQNPMTPGQDSYDENTMNQDIGFTSVTVGPGASASPVVWLTSTPDVNEDDSTIARFQPAGDATESYVVGWHERGSSIYRLARVDAAGAFVEEPADVSNVARWGRRDDPFRTAPNGDVVWAWFDAAGSTTLHLARLRSGEATSCP